MTLAPLAKGDAALSRSIPLAIILLLIPLANLQTILARVNPF